jgi:hypothetical protein
MLSLISKEADTLFRSLKTEGGNWGIIQSKFNSEKHKIKTICTDIVYYVWEAVCCKHPHVWWN